MANLLARRVAFFLWPDKMEYAAICLNVTPRNRTAPLLTKRPGVVQPKGSCFTFNHSGA